MAFSLLPLPVYGERVGVRSILDDGLDRLNDALNILKNIVIPESQHTISDFRKSAVSFCVCVGFEVLASVRLYNQFQFAADEIANVAINRLLTDEFGTRDLSVSQVTP